MSPNGSSSRVDRQIKKAERPTGGPIPFVPRLDKNKKCDPVIRRGTIQHGPKNGKKGYVDTQGRIWIKCQAHGTYPDHWDVKVDECKEYFRVDSGGNLLP
jgi:hypothetical protein